MTWLPVEAGQLPERDAVFGRKPATYRGLREILELSFQMTDPALLDLCRLRLAQLMDARAELASVDPARLEEIARWDRDSGLPGRERAALTFTEQYQIDHHGVTDAMKAELESELSRPGMVNFVWALHMNDAYIRALSLLDIAPDSTLVERPERGATAPSSGVPVAELDADDPDENDPVADLRNPRFVEAYMRLNKLTVRESLVDDTTSEAVRLRNASFQGCHY